MPVIDLPTFRADRASADVRGRTSPEPYAVSSAPPHPEPAEVVLAIDRWNNEGGFVADVDPGLDLWLRRPDPSWGG